jgi:two-component system, OmpR family, alkaline phosphatase synthesis response regulator PhoP
VSGARKVLLVDDEPDIREVAQMSLRTVAGWDVITAENGADGITAAEAEQPDAIVLDVMMPELDGPGTLEKLRANEATRDIPVVFMTAKAQAGELTRFASLGVAGVISKPFDPMTLHERISSLLGWS